MSFDNVVASLESNNDPNAQNPNSSAKGLYQFTDATAKQYGLTDPFDPEQATGAFHELTNDNRAALQKALGRDPTEAELYLAHQQGAAGAIKLLQNPNVPAAQLVGTAAVIHNGGNANMTAQDFANLWENKYNLKAGNPSTQGMVAGPGAPVTDPDLIKQLDAARQSSAPVTDPNLIKQLDAARTANQPGVAASAFSGAETSMNPLLAAGQYAAQGIHNLFEPTVPGVTDKSFSQIEQGIAGQNITSPQAAMQAHPIATMAGETVGNLAQGAIAGNAGGQVLGKVLGAAAPAATATTLDASKIAELTQAAEAEAKATIGNFNPAVPQLTQKLLADKVAAATANPTSQLPQIVQQGVQLAKQYGLPLGGATPGLYQAGKDALSGDFTGAAKGLGKAAIGAVGGKIANVAGVPATVGMAAGAVGGDAYDSQFNNVQNNNDSSMYSPDKSNTDVSVSSNVPTVNPDTTTNNNLSIDNLNQYAPHLGQYANVLQQAAQRGNDALAATNFILQQMNPEYNQMLRNASQQVNGNVSST